MKGITAVLCLVAERDPEFGALWTECQAAIARLDPRIRHLAALQLGRALAQGLIEPKRVKRSDPVN